MEDKDVIIEVADWGLIITVKQGFELNDDNVFQSIKFVFDMTSKHFKKKVIIDWSLTSRKVSFINLYRGVEYLKMLVLSQGIHKQAFIIQNQEDHKDLKFVENVAYNNAIEIRYFFDKASALEWILA